ncbi:MAG: ABC transporter substrate-binding protein [Actinomycetaceae bacterium]|nr:ABC transporter substrate-binding protein [Actinomycetaceae bacterium]
MRKFRATAAFAALLLALAGCSSANPLRGSGGGGGDSSTIVIGSQDSYSSEIIAEVYAQALEREGYEVRRDFRIGQREVYMPEIESGSIDVFPEYTGSLLQYYDKDSQETDPDKVYEQLESKLPDGLVVLSPSDATDQDTYVVTRQFAEEHSVTSIGDLAGIDGLVLGGNTELETRPYGPKGLKSEYDVDVRFTPVEGSGSSTSINALKNGQIQIANIYSANPDLASDDLVALEDPKALLPSARVVPLVSSRLPVGAAKVLDRVSASMSADELVEMNRKSQENGSPASTIASQWLDENDF